VNTLFAFLAAAVGPLVIRALLAIGFTAVSFAGVTTLVNQLVSLASLCGVPEALGLLFAAIVARATLWVGSSATRLIFTGKP
jgi:hypothetical protein